MEPESLIPLIGAQKIILIGDEKQLGPCVVSRHILARRGLSLSSFERCMSSSCRILLMRRIAVLSQGITPLLLDTQYRMHPAILRFPGELIAWLYRTNARDLQPTSSTMTRY